MMRRLTAVLATSILAAAAGAAMPREVVLDRTALPFALSYAACAHRGTEDCSGLRARYTREAEQIFRRYGSVDMLQKRPRFARLLDFIDRDAARLRAAGEAPSPALIGYMDCLGNSLLNDDRFKKGVALDPIPALDACVAERKVIPVADLTSAEDKRTYRYLFNVEAIVKTPRFTNVRDGLLGRPSFNPV